MRIYIHSIFPALGPINVNSTLSFETKSMPFNAISTATSSYPISESSFIPGVRHFINVLLTYSPGVTPNRPNLHPIGCYVKDFFF